MFALGESANGTFYVTAFDAQTAGPGSGRGRDRRACTPRGAHLHRLAAVMPGLTIVFASAGHGVDYFDFKRCGLDDGIWVDQ
jgi:hypothetical protein